MIFQQNTNAPLRDEGEETFADALVGYYRLRYNVDVVNKYGKITTFLTFVVVSTHFLKSSDLTVLSITFRRMRSKLNSQKYFKTKRLRVNRSNELAVLTCSNYVDFSASSFWTD